LIELVLDASVVIKWFRDAGERHVDAARALRRSFEAGDVRVFVPPLIDLEIISVAARRWGWRAGPLAELASSLGKLGFERVEPALAPVARWSAAGLTAYDAAYVAVAEQNLVKLITDDDLIPAVTPEIAEALGRGADS
jgi:predicted nucleic acid-binding protein